MNWGAAWPHYQQALDWWAGQRDLERARTRYLKIVFKAANPSRDDYYFYTSYGNYIPLDVLENALKISNTANDKAHLNFLIAMTMRYTGGDLQRGSACPISLKTHSRPASKPTGTTTRFFITPSG